MKNAKIILAPLETDDREQFILDNQESFQYDAVEEFGLRDNPFEAGSKIISYETTDRSIVGLSNEAYRILY